MINIVGYRICAHCGYCICVEKITTIFIPTRHEHNEPDGTYSFEMVFVPYQPILKNKT